MEFIPRSNHALRLVENWGQSKRSVKRSFFEEILRWRKKRNSNMHPAAVGLGHCSRSKGRRLEEQIWKRERPRPSSSTHTQARCVAPSLKIGVSSSVAQKGRSRLRPMPQIWNPSLRSLLFQWNLGHLQHLKSLVDFSLGLLQIRLNPKDPEDRLELFCFSGTFLVFFILGSEMEWLLEAGSDGDRLNTRKLQMNDYKEDCYPSL